MPTPVNRTWRITTIPVPSPDGGPDQSVTRTVTAAYSTAEDAQPGWLLLKDADHRVVYQIPVANCLDIEVISPDTTTT